MDEFGTILKQNKKVTYVPVEVKLKQIIEKAKEDLAELEKAVEDQNAYIGQLTAMLSFLK